VEELVSIAMYPLHTDSFGWRSVEEGQKPNKQINERSLCSKQRCGAGRERKRSVRGRH